MRDQITTRSTAGRRIVTLRTRLVACAVVVAAALVPSAAVAQAPAGYTMTDFEPERHSFRFVNDWSTGGLSMDVPLVGQVDFAGVAYGLCGGMSFAALDGFHADRNAPTRTSVPPPGNALRTYIWGRQVDSLTIGAGAALARFLDWQWKPQEDQYLFGVRTQKGLTTLTLEEVHFEIVPRLKRGEPVPLGMVNVEGFEAPWGNHQVLAIGYRLRSGNHASIAIYDPNFPIRANNPDGITYLHTSNRAQTLEPSPTGRKAHTGRFRGLFRAPYAKRTPPMPPWTRPVSKTIATPVKKQPVTGRLPGRIRH